MHVDFYKQQRSQDIPTEFTFMLDDFFKRGKIH